MAATPAVTRTMWLCGPVGVRDSHPGMQRASTRGSSSATQTWSTGATSVLEPEIFMTDLSWRADGAAPIARSG